MGIQLRIMRKLHVGNPSLDVILYHDQLLNRSAHSTSIFLLVTLSPDAGWIFLIAASLQMFEWALKKHRNYRKEFKNYPP